MCVHSYKFIYLLILNNTLEYNYHVYRTVKRCLQVLLLKKSGMKFTFAYLCGVCVCVCVLTKQRRILIYMYISANIILNQMININFYKTFLTREKQSGSTHLTAIPFLNLDL